MRTRRKEAPFTSLKVKYHNGLKKLARIIKDRRKHKAQEVFFFFLFLFLLVKGMYEKGRDGRKDAV